MFFFFNYDVYRYFFSGECICITTILENRKATDKLVSLLVIGIKINTIVLYN